MICNIGELPFRATNSCFLHAVLIPALRLALGATSIICSESFERQSCHIASVFQCSSHCSCALFTMDMSPCRPHLTMSCNALWYCSASCCEQQHGGTEEAVALRVCARLACTHRASPYFRQGHFAGAEGVSGDRGGAGGQLPVAPAASHAGLRPGGHRPATQAAPWCASSPSAPCL